MNGFKHILFLFLLIHPVFLPAQDAKIPCNDQIYLTTSDGESNDSQLLKFKLSNHEISNLEILNENLDMSLNAIGYCVLDQFLYGINFENNHLIRIDNNGVTTDLGLPPGLNPDLKYYAGDITPNGLQYVLIGRDPVTDRDVEMYYIRMTTENYSTGRLSIVTTIPTQIEDIAFDPIFGSSVGFDNITKRLMEINAVGAVLTSSANSNSNISSIGGLFFDQKGNLFAYGSTGGSENKLIQLNKYNGEIIQTSDGPSSGFTDACTCPYQISFEKEVEPRDVLPCGEITVTYRFHNRAGLPHGGIYFIEEFPPEFTITEMVRGPAQDFLLSSTGSHIFEMDLYTILLGRDSIILKIDVGDFRGEYSNNAQLFTLPLALGGDRLSDDPTTIELNDPTTIRIIEAGDLFENEEMYFCEETTLTLSAPDSENYLWSTGSTESTIEITEPGLYWLEATGPCEIFRDSVYIIESENDLIVDLGEPLSLIPGESHIMEFESNSEQIQSFYWNTGDSTLSCNNCPNPTVSPYVEQVYNLTITDEYGCTASDDFQISIDNERKIYLPNVFSPNKDGENDWFFIQGRGEVAIKYLRVFNRWGSLVFETHDMALNEPRSGWNGYVKGKKAPEGIYIWISEIEFTDNRTELFSGDVLLLSN